MRDVMQLADVADAAVEEKVDGATALVMVRSEGRYTIP